MARGEWQVERWKLLWKNPNKGSNFTQPQTVPLPGLSNYSEVMIMVRQQTDSAMDVPNHFLYQLDMKFQLFAFVANPVRRTDIFFRSDGIEFSSTGNGGIMTSFPNWTYNPGYCIPTYIYAK